jgi:glycosyltransferase involved in cell wall biosynthesis
LARHALIVIYYFPPVGGGGVQRWVKLVKYLARLDWRFTIIAAPVEKTTPQDPSFLTELPAGTRIIHTVGTSAGQGDWKIRWRSRLSSSYWLRWLSACYYVTDSRIGWNKTVRKYIMEQLSQKNYDLLVFSMPPYSLALLAAEFSSLQSVPVCLDLRDPWIINPYKIYPTPLHRLLDKKRERQSISGLSLYISAYQSIIDHFKNNIPQFNPVNCLLLPNGYDEEDFTDLPEYVLPFRGDWHIAFSGSFYSHLNNPHALFAALSNIKQQGIEIHFHHLGSSVYDVAKLARRHNLQDQFHSWGYQNHRECLKILKAMNAYVLILDERVKNADKTTGGKLFEYLRLKKPILAIVPEHGEAARIIRETGSGIICSGVRIEAIMQAVLEMFRGQKIFRFKNIEQYDRRRQVQQLDGFLKQKLDEYRLIL